MISLCRVLSVWFLMALSCLSLKEAHTLRLVLRHFVSLNHLSDQRPASLTLTLIILNQVNHFVYVACF